MNLKMILTTLLIMCVLGHMAVEERNSSVPVQNANENNKSSVPVQNANENNKSSEPVQNANENNKSSEPVQNANENKKSSEKETIKTNSYTVQKNSQKPKRIPLKNKTPSKVKENSKNNQENDDMKDELKGSVVIEEEIEDFPSQTFQVKEESHTKNPGMKTFEEEPTSSNFPLIFMVSIVLIVGGYFLYHNKTKILGYLLEGGPPSTRRQAGYKKVRNLEEAMPGVRKHVA